MSAMSHHARFLAVLAVGAVFYVVMSTVEMEKRSHHLSKKVHRLHMGTPDTQEKRSAKLDFANAASSVGAIQQRPMQTNSAATESAHSLDGATMQELEKFAEEQAAKAEAAKKALEAARAAAQQQQQNGGQQTQMANTDVSTAAGCSSRDHLCKPEEGPAAEEPRIHPDLPGAGPAEDGDRTDAGESLDGNGGDEAPGEDELKEGEEVENQEDVDPATDGEADGHPAGRQGRARHSKHGHSAIKAPPRHGGGHAGAAVAAPSRSGGGPDGLGAFPGASTCSECSHHGICVRDAAGGFTGCRCAVLYTGAPDCSKVQDFPKPKPMAGFQGRYDKSLILAKSNVEGRSELLAIKDPTADSRAKRKMAPVTKVTHNLLRVLPDKDPTDSRVYSTCAIVGSSGILLRYKRGAEIDAHDMVFRFNSAPTKGFEEYCGHKTTHRITNSRNFAYREFPSEIDMQHMRSPNNIDSLILHKKKHPRTRLFGIHTDFINYMDASLDFLATSGLFGIFIAMHKCVSIDIYGFQVHARHGVQYHYYNPKDKPANEGRDDTEFEVIKALAEARLFKFAEPCILECHVSLEECERCKTAAAAVPAL